MQGKIAVGEHFAFEEVADGPDGFDAVPISEADRKKIGRGNAQRLLRL
jgi:predicted TIM-barrel fold metal-dependent hydrolase